MSSSSIFQRREGDLCSWVEPHKFDDLDEELEEQEYTMDELKQGYTKLADVLASAHIPFAALGGLAMALLGGRPGTLTHDVDLQFKATPVELFNGLRKTEGLRLKTGIQADIFRIHCAIAGDRWVGIDLLLTNLPVGDLSTKHDGVIMLDITPLLQSKLKSFSTREENRDANDILFLVKTYSKSIKPGELKKEYIEFFLENAQVGKEALEMVKKVLSS